MTNNQWKRGKSLILKAKRKKPSKTIERFDHKFASNRKSQFPKYADKKMTD